jgi:aryl sulfotransferase
MALIQATRVIKNGMYDSTRWDGFEFRNDDIIIDTFAKSGTNWTLQIVAQLLSGGDGNRVGMGMGPQLEMTWIPLEATLALVGAQPVGERRFFRSHLPIDALPFNPKVKYINVSRDPRDVVWSAHNHRASFTSVMLDVAQELPGWREDIRDYYLHWLNHDDGLGIGETSLWDHAKGWWGARLAPNVLLVHFNNLKADLGGEIRRIAAFLDIPIDEANWPAILEHCSFEYMRKAASSIEILNRNFKDGGRSIINKGTNGRWREVLSSDEIARCDEIAVERLGPACANWLKTGASSG